jgi:ubiquinone/menaquinone biosynthesis C-methylase UbiE
MDLTPGQSVADIGCGAGQHLYAFADAVGPGGKVWAVDIDPNSHAFIRHRLEQAPARYGQPFPQIEPVLSTPTDVRLPEASVDWAWLHEVHNLTFLQGPRGEPREVRKARTDAENTQLLNTLHRALRPGGRVVILEMTAARNPRVEVSPDEVVAFIESTGLFTVELRDESDPARFVLRLQKREAAP